MMTRAKTLSAVSGLFVGGGALLALSLATPAHALSMKECSAKYHAAKTAGTLGGQDWKSFRTAQCGSSAAAGATTASAAPSGAAPTATTSPAPAASSTPAGTPPTTTAPAKPGDATPATVGNATFPNAVDGKYAKLSAGKARMQTCLDQYHANKADNANGGMKWIQKGGGYYSACSKRLKGAS